MKYLSLVLLVLSMPVLAERNIYDVMFLPKKGIIFGSSAATFTEGKIWGPASTITESGYKFTQSLGYSATDRLSLTTDINFLYKKSDYRYSTNISSDATYERGFSDPSLNAKFRVLEGSFIVDLLGGIVFDTGHTKISNDRKKNNRQGGASYKAGLQLGQKSSSLQWSVLGQYERFSKSHIDERLSTYGDTTMDGNNGYLFQADVLKSVSTNSFVRVFILSQIIDAYSGNGAISFGPITSYETGPEYQYLFSKDLLVKAGISYSTIKSKPSSYDTWHLNLAATYQF